MKKIVFLLIVFINFGSNLLAQKDLSNTGNISILDDKDELAIAIKKLDVESVIELFRDAKVDKKKKLLAQEYIKACTENHKPCESFLKSIPDFISSLSGIGFLLAGYYCLKRYIIYSNLLKDDNVRNYRDKFDLGDNEDILEFYESADIKKAQYYGRTEVGVRDRSKSPQFLLLPGIFSAGLGSLFFILGKRCYFANKSLRHKLEKLSNLEYIINLFNSKK